MSTGGGGGNQTVTNEFKPPAYTTDPSFGGPTWQGYLQSVNKVGNTPYVQSGLAQVAPINDYQNTAYQLQYDKTAYGTPQSNAANGAFMNAAQGNYANPYAQNVMGIASGKAYNPANQGYAQIAAGQANPYMSDEYTKQIMDNTAGQMAKAYSVGGAAQNDAAAAMQGAYGGSAYDEMKARGEAGLAQQIGQMASNVQQQQQQYKGQQYQQGIQNQLQGLAGYSQGYQGDVGNQLAANQQAGNFWNGDINSILSGGALGLQGAAAYGQDISALAGAGNNWNTYMQKLLDQGNNQWNTQNQYDANMNEYIGSGLGRASGSYGTTASTQPGQSLAGQLGGLGLTSAAIYNMLRTPSSG